MSHRWKANGKDLHKPLAPGSTTQARGGAGSQALCLSGSVSLWVYLYLSVFLSPLWGGKPSDPYELSHFQLSLLRNLPRILHRPPLPGTFPQLQEARGSGMQTPKGKKGWHSPSKHSSETHTLYP